jgi:hypothetical protein
VNEQFICDKGLREEEKENSNNEKMKNEKKISNSSDAFFRFKNKMNSFILL